MSPVQTLLQRHRAGEAVGLTSVCCSHALVLRAALQVARDHDRLLLVEATSNQVDQFGGYTGMRPAQFRDYVRSLAQAQGFPQERLVLGGDHLGPNAWQHLPAEAAMQHARVLIEAYVSAGFHKIHLDCSMSCADDPQRLPDETVAERSADLAQVAEAAATAAGLPPPVYVIGTEVPVPGGEASLSQAGAVTRPEAAARTLDVHRQAFAARRLDAAWSRVIAMVVQPGVDFDHSQVQHYVPEAAQALSAFIEGQPGLVFEAHSTDYQLEASLQALVRDHYAILKVGPAATFAMREALFSLSFIEEALLPPEQCTGLIGVLESAMLAQPRQWQKHYGGDLRQQGLLRRYALSDRCRYYWGEPAVQAALTQLIANLDRQDLPLPLLSQFMPEQHGAVMQGRLAPRATALVEHKIGSVLAAYARACGSSLGSARAREAIESPIALQLS